MFIGAKQGSVCLWAGTKKEEIITLCPEFPVWLEIQEWRIKIAQKKAEMNWGPRKKGAMFPLKKTESRVMPSRQALTCVMRP